MTEAEWLSGVDPAPLLRFAEPRLTDRQRLLFMAGCCRHVWDLLTDHRFRALVEAAEAVADGRATEDDLATALRALPRPGLPGSHRRPGDPNPPDWLHGRSRVTVPGGTVIPPTAGTYTVDFYELPSWCQQTYFAVAAVPPRRYLLVAEACENAAAHHAGDAVADRHPLHEEIARLREEVRREHLKAEDLRWRGAGRQHEEALAAAQNLECEADQEVAKLRNEIWSAGMEERITRAAAERAAQTELVRCVAGNPFRTAAADPSWLTSDVVALLRGVEEERAFDRLPILADALQEAGCEDADILAHCRGPHAHTKGCWVVELLKPLV